jgi:hypothetical protein
MNFKIRAAATGYHSEIIGKQSVHDLQEAAGDVFSTLRRPSPSTLIESCAICLMLASHLPEASIERNCFKVCQTASS